MAKRMVERKGRLFYGAVLALAMAAMILNATVAAAQKTFFSPDEAVKGLVEAVRGGNDDGLLDILGPEAADFISSVDLVVDRNGRERFLKAYDEKNSIERQNDVRAVLHVGLQDYALPIPIVRQGESWSFDAAAGREEILNRRIGRNELATVEVLHAYLDAQREYACMHRKPEEYMGFFARRLISSPGKKDGLYWPAGEGETESPFGPLIARAGEHGYTGKLNSDDAEPFQGYFFKILTSQGEHAAGGAYDYVVDDKMILGIGLVAYPARYGSTGIMTFIINQKGVVYQKDQGGKSEEAAVSMTSFDPDETWQVYEEQAD